MPFWSLNTPWNVLECFNWNPARILFVSQWTREFYVNYPGHIQLPAARARAPKLKESITSACFNLRSGFKMFCARSSSVRRTNSLRHIFYKSSRRIVAAQVIDSRTRSLYSTSTNTRIIRSTSHHPDIPVPTNKSYVEFILERCELHGEKHAIVSSYSLIGSFSACCLSTDAKLFTLTILFDRSARVHNGTDQRERNNNTILILLSNFNCKRIYLKQISFKSCKWAI
jgi:hypothetical protein